MTHKLYCPKGHLNEDIDKYDGIPVWLHFKDESPDTISQAGSQQTVELCEPCDRYYFTEDFISNPEKIQPLTCDSSPTWDKESRDDDWIDFIDKEPVYDQLLEMKKSSSTQETLISICKGDEWVSNAIELGYRYWKPAINNDHNADVSKKAKCDCIDKIIKALEDAFIVISLNPYENASRHLYASHLLEQFLVELKEKREGGRNDGCGMFG